MVGVNPNQGCRQGLIRLLLVVALVLPQAGFSAAPQAQTAPAPRTPPPAADTTAVRLVRALAGTKTSEQAGRTVVDDPRQTFYQPSDGQVIIYFEWEGAAGLHHFEGVWIDPQGNAKPAAGFDSRVTGTLFGATWRLPLNERTQPGIWTLDARVDGNLAGSKKVNVVTPKQPLRTFTRTLVPPAEMHQRAVAALVSVQKLGPRGEVLETSSGFVGESGLVFTAFQAVDGASSLRLTLPDGKSADTNELLTWSRREDWAILRVKAAATAKLPLAQSTPGIGDRCFYLDSDAGSPIIIDTTISADSTFPQAGERLELLRVPSPRAVGSAVLNEYGEVVGLLGGIVPGAHSLANQRPIYAVNVMDAQRFLRTVMAVPITALFVPGPSAAPTKLEELARRGLFIPPLQGEENIQTGTVARELRSVGGLSTPTDASFNFNRVDSEAAVVINWAPRKTLKGTVFMRIYDLDNRVLTEASSKMDGQPGGTYTTAWKFAVTRLPAGIYRVDVGMASAVMWRSFFRITE